MIKQILLATAGFILVQSSNLSAQSIDFARTTLKPVHVSMSVEDQMGTKVVKVIKDSDVKASDQPTFVKIEGSDFKNGTIEVKVLSRLLPDAPDYSRGFIGVTFRINDSNSNFEGIYIRPTNGRANDQLRRNHSIQYFSFPDYGFDRLRKEAAGVYESYADMDLNQWIKLTIVVQDQRARLFLDDNKQPSLVVNDLKNGAASSGAIGFWVDIGTEGYFKDLRITKH